MLVRYRHFLNNCCLCILTLASSSLVRVMFGTFGPSVSDFFVKIGTEIPDLYSFTELGFLSIFLVHVFLIIQYSVSLFIPIFF